MASALPPSSGCRPRPVARAVERPRACGGRSDRELPQGPPGGPPERSTPAVVRRKPFVSLGLPSPLPAPAPQLAAVPGEAGEEGASGRGRVASAQDGGLGSAGSALGERPPARRAGVVREVGDAALPDLGPGERDEGGPRIQGPVPGVPGGPTPPGTQHLRVLNGTPSGLPGASLPPGTGNTCSLGLLAGGSSTSSGLHLLWIPRGCWRSESPVSHL